LKHGVPPRRDQPRKHAPIHAGAGRRPASIRKVGILLRLRKEGTSLLGAPAGEDDSGRTEDTEGSLDSDISSRVVGSAARGAREHGQDARVTAGETPALQVVFQGADFTILRLATVHENNSPPY
jgi:hypothetical protein